ncbi:MAG: biotin/lipoyl-binding protein [Clostridia bacterium]|nr:biotin/lipoyl-binding protein [Clostridia bacterium]
MKRMLYGLPALVLALLLGGCAQETAVQEAPALLEPVGVKVDTAVVERSDLYTVSAYEGSLVAAAEELYFEIDGRIGNVYVWPGKWVEAGDVLFELDQTDLEERITSLNRQIDYIEANGVYDDAAAEIDIELLQIKLEKLRGEGAGETAIELAELDIEEARQNLRQAQETRALSASSLREELKLISADYGRNQLTAPFSGHVFYLSEIREGTQVQADKTVAYIANPNDMTLVISDYLSENKLARANYYALIGSKRYEIAHEPMTLQEMTSIILSGNSLPTRFRVVGPEEDLSDICAGQYAVVCLESGRIEDALHIPMGALYTAGSERYVYVQTEDGRERRTVRVGATNGLDAQIVEGLAEGEIVYVKE